MHVIADIDYVHERDLAPTKEILDDYKKKRIDWNEYENRYRRLIEDANRLIILIPKTLIVHACFAVSRRPNTATAAWRPNISRVRGET